MTLSEVEQAIYEYYQFFAQTSPGTRVLEAGRLAQLWRAFDMQIGTEVN